MKDALHYIVTSLVENPDSVHIDETEEEGMTQYSISVGKEDIGKVIGKEGKVIRALRNAMKIKALKHNVRISISLVEAA